ncbi:sucrose-specific PTS transporter subunit IIBC [Streptococcus uberis]|uniref:sucrose-specific PTS transporter subunit IIBC n=1 Tax=Streptococcus uberis TaxID=1349 RepID=UPI001FF6426E|nr:sucrose-specific PTS transporter subunit IIBC [Streptococcus uberis]MCK1159937.1 sucrose-specific PTS transporter subunit IIBC [Streptococcus uberis]MCK1189428.1 sucrose-specific PTS transporter subunit IIBC [Streptococcus uberis]MCK1244761.1 sucrose-specific PTS transporter subunit IIBC [Streptococcus uberis]
MDNNQIAKEVIEALGGRDNVKSVAHCATRLRVMVLDESKIDKEKAENIEKVKGAFFNSGQYQMIFGTGTVNKIYDEVVALGLPTSSKDDMKAEAAKQGNWFQRAVRTFGDVFVPIIPAIVATGLFMGLRGLLGALGITLPNDLNVYSQILTDTAFIALPALVVWSTFRVFGGNPVIGIVLGFMLISGSLPNAWAVASGGDIKPTIFFGFIPVVGLQGSVLPAFIIGIIGAKFEKFVRKYVPEVLDLLVTPFVTLFVMSILGLFVIGPVFHVVENYILFGTKAVLELPFGLPGFLIGGVHQIIVVSGVHHIFNLLESQLIAHDGSNPFNAIITAAMTAQGAATVAVGVKTKNKKLKALAFPAALSAFLGITEPAIFGVNLRYRKPFFLSLIAGAIGGATASLLHLAATGFGITIIPGTLLYLNGQLLPYLIMVAVSFAAGFTLTYLFGFEDEKEGTSVKKSEPMPVTVSDNKVEEILYAPLDGQVIALEEVKDPVFASGAMGQGFAVIPSGNAVYSPVDGQVEVAFETGHAFAIRSNQGAELLIHIGIDTVSMAGTGFKSKVTAGQHVKKGDLLGEFESAKIKEAGLEDTTMVILTNASDYQSIRIQAEGNLSVGQDIMTLDR